MKTIERTVTALEAIIDSPTASAAARVSAARTLLEMAGRIGRHQDKPKSESLSEMTLESMLTELKRLETGDNAEDSKADMF